MNKNILISGIILIACLPIFLNATSSSLYWEAKGLDPYTPEFWTSLDYLTLTIEDWENIDFTTSDFPWDSFDMNKIPTFDFVNLEPKQAGTIFKNEFNVDFEISGDIKTAVYENENKTLSGDFGSFKISDYPEDKYKIEIIKIEEEESLIIIPKKEDGTLDAENKIVLLGGGQGSLFKIDDSGIMEVYLKEGQDIRINNRANMKVFLDDGSTYFIENSGGSFTFNSMGEINAEDANMHLEMFNWQGEKIKELTGSFKMKNDIVMLTKKDSTYDDLILGLHFKSNNEYSPEFVIIPAGKNPSKWPLEDIPFWKRKGTEKEVHIYGYAEVSEDFVSLQGNGYISGGEKKIKINSFEPITNPDDFKTNREFVYNYINKGEEALEGKPEGKKITTPLAIIDTNKKYDYAFGKISLEDNEIVYDGLTSSTQFSRSSEDQIDKDLVRIDGVEDGKIAVFERGNEGLLNIIKDGNYVGIDTDTLELMKNLDYLPERELEIRLGDEEDGAYFFIDSDGGKTYNPGKGNKVSILSRVDALGALGDENSVLLEAQKLIDSSFEEDIMNRNTARAEELLYSLDSYIKNYEGIDEGRVLKAKIKRGELVMKYNLESYESGWFEKLIEEHPEEEYKYTLQENAIDIAENLISSKKVNYAKKFYRNVVDIDKDSEAGSEALDMLDKSASIEAIQYAKLQATEHFMRRISEIKGYKTIDEGVLGEALDNSRKRFQKIIDDSSAGIRSEDNVPKIVSDLLSEIYGASGPVAVAFRQMRDTRVKEAEYELATALSALNIVEQTMNYGANDFQEAFAILENDAIRRKIEKVGNWEQSTIPDFFRQEAVDMQEPPEEIKKLFETKSKYSMLGITANDLHYLVHDDPYFSNFLGVIQSGNAGTEEEERAWLEAAKKEKLRGNIAGAIALAKNVGDRTSNPEIEAEAYGLYTSLHSGGALPVIFVSNPEEVGKMIDNVLIDSFLVDKVAAKLFELAGKAGGITRNIDNLRSGIVLDNFGDADSVARYANDIWDARYAQRFNFGMCFVKGTKITMFDGNIKNIENIKTGDIVLSYDIENKKFVKGKVLSGAFERKTNELIIINNKIKITPQHPVFIINKGYVNAEDLEIGDILFNDKNERVIVRDIEKEKLKEKIQVYNFDVDDEYDNYFAGDILVENTNPVNPCAGARDTTDILKPTPKYREVTSKKRLNDDFNIRSREIVINGDPEAFISDMSLDQYLQKNSMKPFKEAISNRVIDDELIPTGVIESERVSQNMIGNIKVIDENLMVPGLKSSVGVETRRAMPVVRTNKAGEEAVLTVIDRETALHLKEYYDEIAGINKQIVSYNRELIRVSNLQEKAGFFDKISLGKEAREIKNQIRRLRDLRLEKTPRLIVFEAGYTNTENRLLEAINTVREKLSLEPSISNIRFVESIN